MSAFGQARRVNKRYRPKPRYSVGRAIHRAVRSTPRRQPSVRHGYHPAPSERTALARRHSPASPSERTSYALQRQAALRTAALRAARHGALPFFDPSHVLSIGRPPTYKGLTLTGPPGSSKATGGNLPFQEQIKFRKGTPEARYQKLVKKLIAETAKHEESKSMNLGVDVYGASKALTAPAAKVLHETLRPIHAVAGGIDAAIQNKDILSAVGKGLAHNKGPTFSDVLKHAGVKNKTARAIAGTALDIAADPTTYLTLGAGTPAKLAAKGIESRGLQVGARLHVPLTDFTKDIRTSGRATATAKHAASSSKAGRRIRRSKPGQAVGAARDVVTSSVVPSAAPRGASRALHAQVRRHVREFKASDRAAQSAINARSAAYNKVLKHGNNNEQVLAAREAGATHMLPPQLKAVEQNLHRDFEQMAEREIHHGVRDRAHVFRPKGPDDAQAYVPHLHKAAFSGDRPKGGVEFGGQTKVSVNKSREIPKPIHTLEAEGKNPFIKDLPTIYAAKGHLSNRRVLLSQMWKRVAGMGRKVEPGKDFHIDREAERIYEVTPEGLHPLENSLTRESDRKAERQIAEGRRKGEFVILNRHLYETVVDSLKGTPGKRGEAARVYDAVQGKWKWLTTVPMPSYHARNLYGDLFMGYEGDMTARALGRSVGAQRALHAREKARRAPEAVATLGARTDRAQRRYERRFGKPVKIKGERTTRGEEIQAAERHGAINTGFVGTELKELGGQRGGPLSRASQYRENIPRYATYDAARRRGLSQAEAAEHSLAHHIDYGDLTRFEKSARRAIPFYTFFARNTGIQARTLLTRPGKLEAVAKVLDEGAKAAGYPDYQTFLSGQKDYEQRGLPFPIKIGGKLFKEFISLPATDLNQLSADPVQQFNNIANRITFWKLLAELPLGSKKGLFGPGGYSFFFQNEIQPAGRPLVPAPDLVGNLSPALRKRFGVARYLDKRSGQQIWGWPAKVDYLFRQLPESNLFVGATTSVKGSRGQSATQQILGGLTGVRSVQDRPNDNAVNNLWTRYYEVHDKLSALNQRGIYKHNATPEYTKLLKQQHDLRDAVIGAAKKRGDKKLPWQRVGRPKGRSSGGIPGGLGSGLGSGLSGGLK